MPSNLRVDNISPSTGTNLGIGTAGGTVTLTGSVTGSLSGLSNTGITTVSAGSASAPSISPTGDSNTGIFFPAADTIAFAEGGAEAARFDDSGRLLIGRNTTTGTSAITAVQAKRSGAISGGYSVVVVYDVLVEYWYSLLLKTVWHLLRIQTI